MFLMAFSRKNNKPIMPDQSITIKRTKASHKEDSVRQDNEVLILEEKHHVSAGAILKKTVQDSFAI